MTLIFHIGFLDYGNLDILTISSLSYFTIAISFFIIGALSDRKKTKFLLENNFDQIKIIQFPKSLTVLFIFFPILFSLYVIYDFIQILNSGYFSIILLKSILFTCFFSWNIPIDFVFFL